MSAGQAFTQFLPGPVQSMGSPSTLIQALSSFLTERFVPSNTATLITVKNQIIPGFEQVFKNGTLLDYGGTPAYTVLGKKITLAAAANGTDVYIIRYFFRAS